MWAGSQDGTKVPRILNGTRANFVERAHIDATREQSLRVPVLEGYRGFVGSACPTLLKGPPDVLVMLSSFVRRRAVSVEWPMLNLTGGGQEDCSEILRYAELSEDRTVECFKEEERQVCNSLHHRG